jgi:hypothetical protein
MRYLGLRERLALHEPLDLVVEAAMGAAHLLRRGARNPRSGRAHARGGGGGEEGAGQKAWTVARDGGYIIAAFRGREERCGRTDQRSARRRACGNAVERRIGTGNVPRLHVLRAWHTVEAKAETSLHDQQC